LFVSIHEALLLSAVAAVAAAICAAGAASRHKIPLQALSPSAVVWAVTAAYVAVFSAWTLGRHYAMATYGLDLGYYANVIYHFGRGHFFRQSVIPDQLFFNHCAPLLAAFAPLTYVFRNPAYLLPLQTLALAAGIPLIYLLAKPETGSRWPAAILAASFALSPLLHGANLYDFHPRCLAVPLVLGAFYFYRRRNLRAGLACTVLLALAQDELALHAVALAWYGGYACGRRRAGLIAAGALAVYFAGVCCFLYPKLTYAAAGEPIHYLGYFRTLAPGTESSAFAPDIVGNKIGYLGTLILPAAAFLPAAGPALLTAATPLAVPALTTTPGVFQLGWQYPLSVLPFIYGCAALGARRLVRAEASRARRFLITAGSVGAVVLPLLFIATFAGRYYRVRLSEAFPGAHEKVLAGAVTRVPRDISLVADEVFAAHLAHRRYLYLHYHFDPALSVAADAYLLDRRAHSPLEMARGIPRLEEWGFTPVEINADYAYFERRAGNRSYDELFRVWFGVIEEWQCWAPGGKEFVADPRARDGRAKFAAYRVFHHSPPGYVYPPGKYRLVFYLRPADSAYDTYAAIFVHAVTLDRPPAFQLHRKIKKINASPDYRPYAFGFKSETAFQLEYDVVSHSPLYFDAVAVESESFTAEAVRAIPADR